MAKKIYSEKIILEEAFKHCSKNGLEGLSVRRLAKKMGSSVMPIYDTFDSKEGLIRALVDYAVQMTFPTEGYENYRERCMYLLDFGMTYPLFYIEMLKLNKKYNFTKNHLFSFETMMRNDSEFKNLSFEQLAKINSAIETYIMGLILWESSEQPINDQRKNLIMEKLKDFMDRIIKSYIV